jgi:hypothetical protein
MKGNKCAGTAVAHVLVLVGGLNWGLVGLGGFFGGEDWNVVHLVLGQWQTVEWLVYVLVGLSALWLAFKCASCKDCH